MAEKEESLELELFIPEAYVKHNDILVYVPGHGYGIRIPASELRNNIMSGRVAAQIIVDRKSVAIVHETAVPKEK